MFCNYTSDTTGTLKSHISRNHKVQSKEDVTSRYLGESTDSEANIIAEPVRIDNVQEDINHPECDDEVEIAEPDEESDDVFFKALAITVSQTFLTFIFFWGGGILIPVLSYCNSFIFSLIRG